MGIPDEPEFKVRTEDMPLDQNQWLLRTVPGGPGSLCDCLTAVLGLSSAESAGLRETLVELKLIKPEKYGFSGAAWDCSRIEALKDSQAFLPFCLLQAVADKYGCVIVIHGLGGQEVHVRPTQAVPESEVHLECLGGIHFNYYIPQAWVRNVVGGGRQSLKLNPPVKYRKARKLLPKYNNPTDSSSDESSSSEVPMDAEAPSLSGEALESKCQDQRKYLTEFIVD